MANYTLTEGEYLLMKQRLEINQLQLIPDTKSLFNEEVYSKYTIKSLIDPDAPESDVKINYELNEFTKKPMIVSVDIRTSDPRLENILSQLNVKEIKSKKQKAPSGIKVDLEL